MFIFSQCRIPIRANSVYYSSAQSGELDGRGDSTVTIPIQTGNRSGQSAVGF
ncbi:MAG: hypothetical protein WCD18_02255 [Thermosynechococcaceae cyanobacterium]